MAWVAARVVDFYREPVIYRPRYLRGVEPMLDGPVLLKLAAGHFPPGWQRDLPTESQESVAQAARAFIRQVCLWENATHYQVLCASPQAGRDAIRENYRLLMALLHPDRLEGERQDWPSNAAQRVNRAYAVLSDDAARVAYDAGLRPASEVFLEPVPRGIDGAGPPLRGRGGVNLQRLAWRSMVIVAVVGGMYLVQNWWFVDRPREMLAESSFVLPASDRSARDSPRAPSLPRFLDFLERPQPLVSPEPAREIPLPEAPPVPGASPSRASGSEATMVVEPLRAATESSRAPPAASRPIVVANSGEAGNPMRLAQAIATPPKPASPAPSKPASAAAGAPTAEQVETLVAALVGSWDAGDADRLMGLLDSDEYGIWKGWRTRSAYSDFFESTRQRRLRMNRLDWRVEGLAARARGEATLLAEFQDGRAKLERTVPVELDIAILGGHPRITRIVLYPVGQ